MENGESVLQDHHARFELPRAKPHYARSMEFRIEHLLLTLAVDMDRRHIRGTAAYSISFIRGVRPKSITLDASELDIDEVRCGGRKVEFTHVGDELTISVAGRASGLEVEIDYSGFPESGIHFIHPSKETPGRPVQAWTQGEDEYSRYWFPCFDSPNMKFTTELRVTVPSKFTVISNGRLAGVKDGEKGKTRTFTWVEGVPHSSYLNSIVIGEFSLIEDSCGKVPLYYYVRKGREEEARRSFGKTADMMSFFSRTIGVDYPYEKYAQVAVADFIWGGMENISATTLTEDTLHEARADNDFPSHPLVAHELAHQWWGDLLTTKDWSHVWLNEGFATYFEALYRQHDRGQDEFEYELDSLSQVYFREDAGRYRRPIMQRSFLMPTEMFDRTTYQKGALVLHMLRTELGDDLFFAAIRKYCEDNRERNVESSDLLKAVEQATGRNMQLFFDQWVYGAGYPEFEASYSYNSSRKCVEIGLKQVQKLDDMTHTFSVDLDISICLAGGRRKEGVMRVRSSEAKFEFETGERPLFVSIDPHNSILKKLKYERPTEDAIAQLAGGSAFEKVQAARELSRVARKSSVEALAKQLGRKNFWAVHAECAQALGRLNRSDALEVLMKVDASDSRARKFIVSAIGAYRDSSTLRKLESFLRDDSYAVQAEAVTAIAGLQDTDPRKILDRAMGMDSHFEIVRQAALSGYADFGDAGDIEKLKKYTTPDRPTRVRVAAMKAIARLGREDEKVRKFIFSGLGDVNTVFRRGVVAACELTRSPEAVRELQNLIERERDGVIKRDAFDAINSLRGGMKAQGEIRVLEKEVAEVRGELRELRRAVELLQQKKGRGK